MSLSLDQIISELREDNSDVHFERWAAIMREQAAISTRSPHHGGSRTGKAKNLARDPHGAWNTIRGLYWGSDSKPQLYSDEHIHRRYRISKAAFLSIHETIVEANPLFKTKRDATGKLGCVSFMKILVCLRMLATGSGADACDSEYQMSESQINLTFKTFVETMSIVYSPEYIRDPAIDIGQIVLFFHVPLATNRQIILTTTDKYLSD
jgi:hypothetical protein